MMLQLPSWHKKPKVDYSPEDRISSDSESLEKIQPSDEQKKDKMATLKKQRCALNLDILAQRTEALNLDLYLSYFIC